LGQLDASHVLDEPVVYQSLSVAIEAGVIHKELFLERFWEVELLAGTDFVGEAVRKDDLGVVSERSCGWCDPGFDGLLVQCL
jgi:hypothetical protein